MIEQLVQTSTFGDLCVLYKAMEDLFMQDELFLRRTALYSVQEGNHFVGKEKVFLTSCRSGATL